MWVETKTKQNPLPKRSYGCRLADAFQPSTSPNTHQALELIVIYSPSDIRLQLLSFNHTAFLDGGQPSDTVHERELPANIPSCADTADADPLSPSDQTTPSAPSSTRKNYSGVQHVPHTKALMQS